MSMELWSFQLYKVLSLLKGLKTKIFFYYLKGLFLLSFETIFKNLPTLWIMAFKVDLYRKIMYILNLVLA